MPRALVQLLLTRRCEESKVRKFFGRREVRMTASAKSIKMKLLLFSLVGLINMASSDAALPPEISKCCTDDTAPECKRIDAAVGYKGYLYTFFGAYYAKLRVNSKGVPEALVGYPKKITGNGVGSWFGTNVKVDKNSPLDKAYAADDCVKLVLKSKSHCFEINAAPDGETIEWKSETVLSPQMSHIVAVMATKFQGQTISWIWFWEMVGSKCMVRIREGSTPQGKDTEVPAELIPRAVAGILGDTFKGFVFLRDSGLVYPFSLKAKETKIIPSGDKLKASLFMGCSRVPTNSTTTVKTTDETTVSTPKVTEASTSTKLSSAGQKPTPTKGIPLLVYIIGGIIMGVVVLAIIVTGAFLLTSKKKRKNVVRGSVRSGSGATTTPYTGRGRKVGGRVGGQSRRDDGPQSRDFEPSRREYEPQQRDY